MQGIARAARVWIAALVTAPVSTSAEWNSYLTRASATPPAAHVAVMPRRVALLIGVGSYTHFEWTGPPGRTKLRSPPNDIARMSATLRGWGFGDTASTRVLQDSLATRRGILAAFDWLARTARDTADIVVVYYTGHGDTAPDVDQDERTRTPGDVLDEALVPWDVSNPPQPSQLVIDDDIEKLLAALNTAHVTVIVDACFSGTITRDPGLEAKGPQPSETAAATPGPTRDATDIIDFMPNAQAGYTIISAASPRQTAFAAQWPAAGQEWIGLLTYSLSAALDGALHSGASLNDVMFSVRDVIRERTSAQTPQFEGTLDDPPFGARSTTHLRPFALVSRVGTSRCALDLGSVHGVARFMRFDVYAPGTSDLTSTTAHLGELVVDSVERGRSFTSADSCTPNVQTNSLATLARLPRGSMAVRTLTVGVGGLSPSERDSLQKYSWVRTSLDSTTGVTVTRETTGFRVSVRGKNFARLPRAWLAGTQYEQWADGDFPVQSRNEYATIGALCNPLRRALVMQQLEAVEMKDVMLGLKVRYVPFGKDPNETATIDTLYQGEWYRLMYHVRANTNVTRRLWLSVVSQGFVYPPLVPLTRERPAIMVAIGEWTEVQSILIPPEAPTGADALRALVTAEPEYSLVRLRTGVPSCAGGDTRLVESDSDPNLWRAVTYNYVIAPARRRSP